MKRLIVLFLANVALAGAALALSQPRTGALPLETSIHMEQLETVQIPRLRLSGRETIQMDTRDFLEVMKGEQGESLVLNQRLLPSNRMSFYMYPNASVPGSVTPGSLAQSLRKQKDEAERQDAFFEILELPASTTGPAKIRFLGAKPITATYVVMKEIGGQPQKIVVMDSWAELGDHTYLLRIEAPEARFDHFFNQMRRLANTMHFAN